MDEEVRCWEETIVMPTYLLEEDEKNPILNFPVSGPTRSSRPVYPYPMQDMITRKREEKAYRGVFLENRFVKLLVMPDFRGRLQGAVDKSNGWDFLYWNHVIKPAIIAVRGAWLSGGIEWNHPGGHGYTQFNKISYVTLDNPDGSKSIVVGEIEPIRSHKWVVKVTLYPDRSYVETEVKLINLFPVPVPFYCSMNGAMHATDETEIIYPPCYVTGHGVREVYQWPIVNGVDYRFLKNVLHPLSFFSMNLKKGQGYYGCYSYDKNAGTAVVAHYAKVPGQKYFTWGKWDDGRLWGKILSDEDGEYIELQSGVFWHNVGYGYAWLDAHELKQAKVYWYPIKEIGAFKKANKEAAVNLEVLENKKVRIGLITTKVQSKARITLKEGEKELFSKTVNVSPVNPFVSELPLPPKTDTDNLTLTVSSAEGERLISYNNCPTAVAEQKAVVSGKPLKDMTIDELYMRGMAQSGDRNFLMQPRSLSTEEAFQEALKRDPYDSRANRALGVVYYTRGCYDEADQCLKRSLERDDLDGSYEAHYYLGLIHLERGELDEAEEEFWKASNRYTYHSPSCYFLAEIAMRRGQFGHALELAQESLTTNTRNMLANELKIVALRKLGRLEEAVKQIEEAKSIDPTDFMAWSETYFIQVDKGSKGEKEKAFLNSLLDREDHSFIGTQLYLELAINYLHMSLLDEAVTILSMARERAAEKSRRVYPLVEYYLAYLSKKKGNLEKTRRHLSLAAEANPNYCFPYRKEDITVLQDAAAYNPKDAKAHYYLGNVLWYLNRREEAISHWEKSANIDGKSPIIHRNLGNAYATVDANLSRAVPSLEKAFSLEPNEPRILLELVRAYELTGETKKVSQILEGHANTAEKLDDLTVRRSIIYLRLGKYEEALKVLESHYFIGREVVVQGPHNVYSEILLRRAEEHLEADRYSEALKDAQKSLTYPENMRQAEHYCRDFCRENYLVGCAYEGLGMNSKAKEHWKKAAVDDGGIWTMTQYYRSLSLLKLDREDEAKSVFEGLLSYAKTQLEQRKRRSEVDETGTLTESFSKISAQNHYLLSLGHRGLGKLEEADEELRMALKLDPDVKLNAWVSSMIRLPRVGYRRPWDRLAKESSKSRKTS